MNHHRAVALERALRQIDANPGVYQTKDQQDRVLAELTDRHRLQSWKKTHGSLQVDDYRQAMQKVAMGIKQSKGYKITEIFLRGSEVVLSDAREQIRSRAAPLLDKGEESSQGQNQKGESRVSAPDSQADQNRSKKRQLSVEIEDESEPPTKVAKTSHEQISATTNATASSQPDKTTDPEGKKRQRSPEETRQDDVSGRAAKARRIDREEDTTFMVPGKTHDELSGGGQRAKDLQPNEAADSEGEKRQLSVEHASESDKSGRVAKAPKTDRHSRTAINPQEESSGQSHGAEQLTGSRLPNETASNKRLSSGEGTSEGDVSGRAVKAARLDHHKDTSINEQAEEINQSHNNEQQLGPSDPVRRKSNPDAQAGVVGPAPGVTDNQHTAADNLSQYTEGYWHPSDDVPAGSFALDPEATVASRNTYAKGAARVTGIGEQMGSIFEWASQAACRIIKNAGMADTRNPEIVFNPKPDLELLYRKMFGVDWEAHAARIRFSASLNDAGELIGGLLMAAIQRWVWEAELPTNGPLEMIDSYAGDKDRLNKALRQIGKFHDLDEEPFQKAVWQAARTESDDRDHLEKMFESNAHRLACRYMNSIYDQLIACGGTEKALRQMMLSGDRIRNVEDVFSRALILKSQTRSSPENFRMAWVSSGVIVKTALWEPLYGSRKDRPNTVEVLWPISPIVWKWAYESPGAKQKQWLLMCHGQVNNMTTMPNVE